MALCDNSGKTRKEVNAAEKHRIHQYTSDLIKADASKALGKITYYCSEEPICNWSRALIIYCRKPLFWKDRHCEIIWSLQFGGCTAYPFFSCFLRLFSFIKS